MTVAATKKRRINIYCIVSALSTEEITLAGRQVNRHSCRFRPEVFLYLQTSGGTLSGVVFSETHLWRLLLFELIVLHFLYRERTRPSLSLLRSLVLCFREKVYPQLAPELRSAGIVTTKIKNLRVHGTLPV